MFGRSRRRTAPAPATIPEDAQKAELDVHQAKANLDVANRTAEERKRLLQQGAIAARDTQTAIAAAGLPTRLEQAPGAPFSATALISHMAQDKKAQDGRLTFVLAKGIGEAFVAKGVDSGSVRAFLLAEGATP